MGRNEEAGSVLGLVWCFLEELVCERIGVLLEARLQRCKPLIHIPLDRTCVADAGTDERHDQHEQRSGDDPAHYLIGHRFEPFGRSQYIDGRGFGLTA